MPREDRSTRIARKRLENMAEQLISEEIQPVTGTADTSTMSLGEPGLPRRFVWRNTEYKVREVIQKWKETSPCRHGSGEQYVRKHWYKLRMTDGSEMKIYFDRQARHRHEEKARWWLYTISAGGKDST